MMGTVVLAMKMFQKSRTILKLCLQERWPLLRMTLLVVISYNVVDLLAPKLMQLRQHPTPQ